MIESLLSVVIMLIGLFIIPFGLPGLWLMIGVVAFGVFSGVVAWWTLAILVVLGIIAELLEFVAVKRASERHGGTKAAFWGAIAGGLLGAIFLSALPVIGSFIGGVIGTFAGAMLVTIYEQRDLSHGVRVGFGAALGRAIAIAIKIAVAIIVLIVGSASIILGNAAP